MMIQLDTEISNKLMIPGTKTGQLPLYGLVFSNKPSTSDVKQKQTMNWRGMEENRTKDGREWREVGQKNATVIDLDTLVTGFMLVSLTGAVTY